MKLPQQGIEACFPFYFATDSSGVIIDCGKSLQKIFNKSLINSKFEDNFKFLLPNKALANGNFDSILSQTIVILNKSKNIKLIGQIQKDTESNSYLFLTTIQLHEVELISSFGLNFSDFAPQDQVFDFLMAYHSYKKSEVDLQKLNLELENSKNIAVKASEMKSKFLANMSHELRTPLNAIIGLTSVLLEKTNDQSSKDMLKIISTSSDQLLSLISDILDLSKIEEGQIKIETKLSNIRNNLTQFVTGMDMLAKEKGNTLTLNVDNKIPEFVNYDSVRLVQVLTNLVGNSIKFTRNGSISINLEQVEQESNSIRIKFEVVDTGSGMSPGTLNKIFMPFFQLEHSEKNLGGTGLGLSICKNIINAMNGDIRVESNLNEGSKFYFTLPFQVI